MNKNKSPEWKPEQDNAPIYGAIILGVVTLVVVLLTFIRTP